LPGANRIEERRPVTVEIVISTIIIRDRGSAVRYDMLDGDAHAYSLGQLRHFEEAKSLLRKTIRVARRVLGENHELTLRMRWCYGKALYSDANAPLDDLREAVLKHEELERIARRVLGGAHPMVAGIEKDLRNARILLAAHETPSTRTSA